MDTTTRLQDLALSESGFLFDPYTGLTFSLNASARAMLEGLKKGDPPERIVTSLRERFALTDVDDPERDLQEFLRMLREHGLLPRDARP